MMVSTMDVWETSFARQHIVFRWAKKNLYRMELLASSAT